jgi:SAM-dependent methyltransferase
MRAHFWRLRAAILALARPFFDVGLQATAQVSGKLRPFAPRGGTVVLDRGEREDVPPEDFWLRYADNAEDYLADGRTDMDSVVALLITNGIPLPRVTLDLGCASGRMIRHFPRTEGSEIWGADIRAGHIAWCQRNLPELNFVTVSTAPHLPFADGYFDFVMCASVFTHITDLADAWLLEIRRVLKAGGHLYLTLHDKLSAHEMRTVYAEHLGGMIRSRLNDLERGGRIADADIFYFGTDPASQVFYDREYITGKWSRWMDLVAYEERFHNYQSAMLLRKRG